MGQPRETKPTFMRWETSRGTHGAFLGAQPNLDCLTEGDLHGLGLRYSLPPWPTPLACSFSTSVGCSSSTSGVRDLAALLPEPLTPAEIVDRWTRCPHSVAFGIGRTSAQEYAERFVRDWRINLAPDVFLREYRSWSRRLYPGARELLAELRPRYRLAALSNSNEAHWDRNTNEIGVTELFDVAISSHQVGLAKPDPAIYLAALARLEAPARDVVFFDDSLANVTAAVDLGMRAFQVDGVDDIRLRLAAEGLL